MLFALYQGTTLVVPQTAPQNTRASAPDGTAPQPDHYTPRERPQTSGAAPAKKIVTRDPRLACSRSLVVFPFISCLLRNMLPRPEVAGIKITDPNYVLCSSKNPFELFLAGRRLASVNHPIAQLDRLRQLLQQPLRQPENFALEMRPHLQAGDIVPRNSEYRR